MRLQHRRCTLNNGVIEPFSNAVLVGLIANGMLSSNTMLRAICVKCSRDIFTSFIITQNLDFAASLSLQPRLVRFECLKSVRLVSEQLDCCKSTVMVDKGNPVPVALRSCSGEWSMQIRMNQAKELIFSDALLVYCPVLLARNAGLAFRLRYIAL